MTAIAITGMGLTGVLRLRRSVPIAKYGRQPLTLSDRMAGLSLLAGDAELSRSGVPAQLNVTLFVGSSWLRRSGFPQY